MHAQTHTHTHTNTHTHTYTCAQAHIQTHAYIACVCTHTHTHTHNLYSEDHAQQLSYHAQQLSCSHRETDSTYTCAQIQNQSNRWPERLAVRLINRKTHNQAKNKSSENVMGQKTKQNNQKKTLPFHLVLLPQKLTHSQRQQKRLSWT